MGNTSQKSLPGLTREAYRFGIIRLFLVVGASVHAVVAMMAVVAALVGVRGSSRHGRSRGGSRSGGRGLGNGRKRAQRSRQRKQELLHKEKRIKSLKYEPNLICQNENDMRIFRIKKHFHYPFSVAESLRKPGCWHCGNGAHFSFLGLLYRKKMPQQ